MQRDDDGVPRARRDVPRRAPAALLPDRRLAPGRRGSRAGDAAGRLARPGWLRGASFDAHVAVPDRDEPLAEPAARPRAAYRRPRRRRRPTPTRPSTEPLVAGPVPVRGARGRRARLPDRAAAPAAAPARGARAARRAQLPRRARSPRCSRSPRSAVTSALHRAPLGDRRRPRDEAPLPGSREERSLVARFTAAFERGDVDGVVALLTADARLTMPPYPLEYEGPEAIRGFLSTVPAGGDLSQVRLVPTRANGQPAFGCYVDGRPLRDHGADAARRARGGDHRLRRGELRRRSRCRLT